MDWQAAIARKYDILDKQANANMIQANAQAQEGSWRYAPGGLDERNNQRIVGANEFETKTRFGPGGMGDRELMMNYALNMGTRFGIPKGGDRPLWMGDVNDQGSPSLTNVGMLDERKKRMMSGGLAPTMGGSNWMTPGTTMVNKDLYDSWGIK